MNYLVPLFTAIMSYDWDNQHFVLYIIRFGLNLWFLIDSVPLLCLGIYQCKNFRFMSNLIPENKCRPKVDYFYNNLLQMTYGPMHLQKTYLTSIHRMLQYFSISLCCRLGYDLLSNCNNDL